VLLAQSLAGDPLVPPPETTALGGIRTHLARKQPHYQPSNITWACIPPLPNRRLKKRERYAALAERALVDLGQWLETAPQASAGPRRT